jgi:hypothetical protein
MHVLSDLVEPVADRRRHRSTADRKQNPSRRHLSRERFKRISRLVVSHIRP